jgi:tRNA A-37 threonylcarbamoyl transferase component Bud32
MFGLAAAFLGYFTLLLYCEARRTDPLGFLVRFDRQGMLVQAVRPGSAAARAGLSGGDRILTAAGRAIRVRGDWTVVEASLPRDSPLVLGVERGNARLQTTLSPTRASIHFWRTGPGVVLGMARLTQFATLLIALLVAFKRPDDPLARLGAWLLASGAVFSIVLPPGIAAAWGQLPAIAGLPLWLPFASSLCVGAILFTFFSAFPRPLFTSWMVWAAAWTPMIVVEAQFLMSFVSVVYRPDRVGDPPDAANVMLLSALYTGAGLIVLTLNYSRLRDVNERRRVQSILPGSIVALVSGVIMPIGYLTRSPVDMTEPLFGSPMMAVGTVMLLALPFSFAYAILRRRMFDLTTLLRQGVRYALARRVVLMAPLILGAVLVADAVSQYEKRVGDVLAARLTIYGVLIAVAVYVASRREQWLSALDRRFFRERYNAQRIVRGVATRLRESGTAESVAPFVVAQIEEALHPRFAALMVRAAGTDTFKAGASAPAGAAPPPIPAHWKLVAVARLFGQPLLLSPEGDEHLTRRLPPVELAFVESVGIELLLPIAYDESAPQELLLALGAKRSEEPYSAEDLELLGGVAAALALVVARGDATPRVVAGLEECPACGRCYDSGTVRCVEEHGELQPARIERVVAHRYRLERRIAEGGMSRLYKATDVALQREVAVKVLRDEWMALRNGPERFRREAQIAAGFAHPHVVTIFDFGLSGGSAFLVMELLLGRTLRDEMHEHGRLPVLRVIEILRSIGSAIEAAHSRRLVHRDLKPENIFVCRTAADEVVKVLDFGISRFVGPTRDGFSTGGLLIGTPAYMAPEQLRGEDPTPGWDLWALAAMTYEMLTGTLPFATAAAAGASGRATGTGTRYDTPGPRLTGDLVLLQSFFAEALAIDGASRPKTAREFVAAFESASTLIPAG